MSTNVSTVIGDVVRWIIALIILPFVLWIIFLFFMYPFEWLLSKSTRWGWFLHVSFWFMIGIGLVLFTTAVGGVISTFSLLLVRQTKAYAGLFLVAMLGLVGFCVYGTWSDNVEFSWEVFRYATFNRILFTLLILNILQIPLSMLSPSKQ